MTKDKLLCASIGLFIKTLVLDGSSNEPNKKLNDSANKIASLSSKYVRKHFKTPRDKELLAVVSNTAWDMSCNLGEAITVSIGATCMELFDSNYKELLKLELGYNEKMFQSLYNIYRDGSSLRVKLDSKRLAEECIANINKCIYDKFTKVNNEEV